MIAIGIIIGLSVLECVLCARDLKRNEIDGRGAAIAWIAVAAAFLSLTLVGILDWGFRWYGLGLLLSVRALIGAIVLVRRAAPAGLKRGRAVGAAIGRVALAALAAIPLILFPPYGAPKPTGSLAVGTAVFTWADAARDDPFTPEADERRLSVQLWYPAAEAGADAPALEGTFPLVLFSHGAFGYRLSNHSTFMELASNGYVVASIDHTRQAFMTKEADGTVIMGDRGFMSTAMRVENGDIQGEELYLLEREWMALRSADMAFALDRIRRLAASPTSPSAFRRIDIEKIGALGHSMGGATAAWLGREDTAVDAVIVLDGTMMGETTGFEGGREVLSDLPYPTPILNLFNERHYIDGAELGPGYANMRMHANAPRSFQAVVRGAGHLNFTDLPIISPILGRMLGTGTVDARYCIEATNGAVLEFLNYYLKGQGSAIPTFRSL